MAGLIVCAASIAQQTTLYDPQPPANSAYVRVIVGGGAQTFDVWVNKKPRLSKVASASPSAYMVLPAGSHELSVQTGALKVPVKVDAVASRSFTVLVSSLDLSSKPVVLEDKVNSNRLKAIITAYQLGAPGSLDVWTADGGTPIFKGLALGASASLVVNPINLEYLVATAGSKTALATGKLNMSPGGAYSMVLTANKEGGLSVQTHANTVERFKPQ